MADRPKKKIQTSGRNPDRRNGKAPKKNPGPAITPRKVLTPEQQARKNEKEQLRIAASIERAKIARKEAQAARAAAEKAEQTELERKNLQARQREAELKRKSDAEAARRIAKATITRV